MTRLVVVLGAVTLSSLGGCKKPPSPAQLAASAFVEASVKDPHGSGSGTLDGKMAVINVGPGEPVEGTSHTCGETLGRLEWVRSRPETQSALPNGDVLTQTSVDICMATDEGTCNRPNSYSFKAIMRSEGSEWKVAGSTCAVTNIVR